ncbi:hypothetical protein AB4144_63045, partial [Rhizobiaceae sp. 2RAB30]
MGLTGTVIAWRDELDTWLNPDLLQASSATRIPVGAATVESVTAKRRQRRGERGIHGRASEPLRQMSVMNARGTHDVVDRVGGDPGLLPPGPVD